jgi:hypothetical protein
VGADASVLRRDLARPIRVIPRGVLFGALFGVALLALGENLLQAIIVGTASALVWIAGELLSYQWLPRTRGSFGRAFVLGDRALHLAAHDQDEATSVADLARLASGDRAAVSLAMSLVRRTRRTLAEGPRALSLLRAAAQRKGQLAGEL